MVSKVSLSALAVACALTAPVGAFAQARYSFDLPPQPLEKSLNAVASRTGTNIVFSNQAVRGKEAPALRGDFDAKAAYRQLLGGSGLTLSVTSGGSYVVGQALTQGSAADGPAGSIVGHVAEADGSRNVAGALVRIVETGQTAKADDLGDFRFPSVRPGTYTIEISFLGFPTITETVDVTSGRAATLDLAMGDSGATEIVVYGSRSATAVRRDDRSSVPMPSSSPPESATPSMRTRSSGPVTSTIGEGCQG
jgi:hypothetical protein